ncbi:efflux RND transporter periplasmic adaptor subunit [Allochromatium vinosum]|uniref:Efflux transporter, RND family, MFP subunit n=1 Tax=Allochromatium vinosum (strain ATCC 17899 / DSM 180 / NBRC 103801 / NCIMB 10441 / D) TaxID=572477 RepID=D3RP27_ALLVD|nr:efflux RND transporter periplasmic adaptor subunit [Allochromatium vinosum]ADC61537.1 efflux transporter, RND family, MFP subunit [Allochromatium vinosum DSM 180]
MHALDNTHPRRLSGIHRLGLGLALVFGLGGQAGWLQADDDAPARPTKPALTVTTTRPEIRDWPRTIAATGNIAAWREVVVGAEIGGDRLVEVLVEIGDRVERGQLLARIDSDSVTAAFQQARAAVAEAEALLAEARADADRARESRGTAALSAQQADQYLSAERTALARLDAARARVRSEELRLSRTSVLAPVAGIVASLSATQGSLVQPGDELLRLIRDSRLEWRAEVPATELARLQPGGPARILAPDGTPVNGQIRRVAPTIDARTLTGLVYVDLPAEATGRPLRAGMFVRGELDLGESPALTLPQSAVLAREGFAYVFRLEPGGTVIQTKVGVDRRLGDRVEITAGLEATAEVVDSGVGFLADGDLVRLAE